MTPDQWINLYTITIAILSPVTGATIWLVSHEKTTREKAKEKSLGAQAVFDLMNQMKIMDKDIERLKQQDDDKSEEIRILEEDYKNLNKLIIELLKTK